MATTINPMTTPKKTIIIGSNNAVSEARDVIRPIPAFIEKLGTRITLR